MWRDICRKGADWQEVLPGSGAMGPRPRSLSNARSGRTEAVNGDNWDVADISAASLKGEKRQKRTFAHECERHYLMDSAPLAYSPDFSPIAKAISRVKAMFRKICERADSRI